tara:strand:+ start:2072 stop:2917 length:846 start_codon:yes stop_codon:yes gene_type:complete
MTNDQRYLDSCYLSCKEITKRFSTSFSLGIFCLDKSIRHYVYAVYGLVRVGDEIVDTFFDTDQAQELDQFEKQTYDAIKNHYSSNVVLHAFQDVVNKFKINKELIRAFFNSMRMDLNEKSHDESSYKKYIYGSAEVVGLMCLYIFIKGDKKKYSELETSARKLGSAFQKVNFLRDIHEDFDEKGRSYFPNISLNQKLDEDQKELIIRDIDSDFIASIAGITKLPKSSRFGVLLAFKYYKVLLLKISKVPAEQLSNVRISVSNAKKIILLFSTFLSEKLKIK